MRSEPTDIKATILEWSLQTPVIKSLEICGHLEVAGLNNHGNI